MKVKKCIIFKPFSSFLLILGIEASLHFDFDFEVIRSKLCKKVFLIIKYMFNIIILFKLKFKLDL